MVYETKKRIIIIMIEPHYETRRMSARLYINLAIKNYRHTYILTVSLFLYGLSSHCGLDACDGGGGTKAMKNGFVAVVRLKCTSRTVPCGGGRFKTFALWIFDNIIITMCIKCNNNNNT